MTKSKSKFKKQIKLINWYPPYLFSGIRVSDVNEDVTKITVQLRLTWYNKNLFGSHFGGSLYAMCDPFYVFIAVVNFGDQYIIWDKSSKINFKKPGYGIVSAIFEINQNTLETMKKDVEREGKKTFSFNTQIKNEQCEVVAEVEKEIYIRKKTLK